MIFFMSIYLLGLLGSLWHIYTLPSQQRSKAKIIEILLLYQIVFSLGITSLVAFLGLSFMAEYIAELTQWPASPFEQQMANVNLAFGILGLMSIFYRGDFWLAVIVGFSIWILSDGFHHLYQALMAHNLSSGNIGVPMWTDFIVPIILLVLLYFHRQNRNPL